MGPPCIPSLEMPLHHGDAKYMPKENATIANYLNCLVTTIIMRVSQKCDSQNYSPSWETNFKQEIIILAF